MIQGRAPVKQVTAGSVMVGLPGKPVLMAGPCVIESREMTLEIAGRMGEAAARHGFGYIFKASFDKANRTSVTSYRGPGLEEGLSILEAVREELGIPVMTDVHQPGQVAEASRVVDVIQIPAFLCRQTDLILAAAGSGRPVNIKKGQFLSPEEMKSVVEKALSTGNDRFILTERGTFFGYGRLVVDMAGMAALRSLGCPVIFDATHSAQRPGALGDRSGGDRMSALTLARAAAAAGCDGLFIEVHPEPDRALSDAATSLDFQLAEVLLGEAAAIFSVTEGNS